jgi:hypothetical protein
MKGYTFVSAGYSDQPLNDEQVVFVLGTFWLNNKTEVLKFIPDEIGYTELPIE